MYFYLIIWYAFIFCISLLWIHNKRLGVLMQICSLKELSNVFIGWICYNAKATRFCLQRSHRRISRSLKCSYCKTFQHKFEFYFWNYSSAADFKLLRAVPQGDIVAFTAYMLTYYYFLCSCDIYHTSFTSCHNFDACFRLQIIHYWWGEFTPTRMLFVLPKSCIQWAHLVLNVPWKELLRNLKATMTSLFTG